MALNKARFMEHLSPQGNFSGTGLKSIDQCATEVILDQKDESRRYQTDPDAQMASMMGGPNEWKKQAQERAVLSKRMKRLDRGGSTVRPGDGIEKY